MHKYIVLVPNDGHWPSDAMVLGLGRHCFVGREDPPSSAYLPTPWQKEEDKEIQEENLPLRRSAVKSFGSSYSSRLNIENGAGRSGIYKKKKKNRF